jgi:hypothetical protein
MMRALRLSQRLYGTPLIAYDSPARVRYDPRPSDRLFLRRLLARDGWGRQTRAVTSFGFYARGHLMRMPPLMLARHLLKKARG